METSLILADKRLAIALCSAAEAETVHQAQDQCIHFFDVETPAGSSILFSPASFLDIRAFGCVMERAFASNPSKMVGACLAREDQQTVTLFAQLMGGFMILYLDLDLEEVVRRFEPWVPRFVSFADASKEGRVHNSFCVQDCWRACARARAKGWLDFTCSASSSADAMSLGFLNLDRDAHYSQEINGGACVVVPGKLIVIPRPDALPPGCAWCDGQGGARQFSVDFYGPLLHDEFQVSTVVCLEDLLGAPYNKSAFASYGIRTYDLGLNNSGLLKALDRFLAITEAAPGCVAIHGASQELGLLGAFVVLYLTQKHRFDAMCALAWIRMVCPKLLVPSHVSHLGDGA